MLVVVWWALRLLPGLLARTTAPATALGGVCATVLALWAGRVVHMAFDSAFVVRGPVFLMHPHCGVEAPPPSSPGCW